MSQALYLAPTGTHVGKRAVALGAMNMLVQAKRNVAVFYPVINPANKDDRVPELAMMLRQFNLRQNYEDTYAYTYADMCAAVNEGKRSAVIENILRKFKALAKDHDFVLCVGVDVTEMDPVFAFALNAEIASNLGCPAMLIQSGKDQAAEDVRASLQLVLDSFAPHNVDVIAGVITRADLSSAALNDLRHHFGSDGRPALIYAIPEEPILGRVTMRDIKKALGAETVFGEAGLDSPVAGYLVAAMHVDNFLHRIAKDYLIVAPGDRTDVLLAAVTSRMSVGEPDLAGVLLTGGQHPTAEVCRLIKGLDSPLPVLLHKEHTYRTVTAVHAVCGDIEPADTDKINAAMDLFGRHVNGGELLKRLDGGAGIRMTPKLFEMELAERARAAKMRIVLAEGEEPRILMAADVLLDNGIADIILLGDEEKIRRSAAERHLDISRAVLINPAASDKFEDYAATYAELRKAKGVTIEKAREKMSDATYFATMMVKKGDADGMVSGAVNTTAHTIVPSFEFIKTKPGFSVVSSVFLMCLKDRVLVFGDCAVNPNPTADQLAEIAVSSARTAKIFGIEPRVAMLSYSTGSSGKGPDVDVVIEATKKAREIDPELVIEGPIQYDAALDPTVAKTKLPDSKVAGQATVFIFPDLNTGNNTYKAVQRAANAIAIGPVLQGLNKPVNDLSRGCTVPDIINTVAITAIQAAAERQK